MIWGYGFGMPRPLTPTPAPAWGGSAHGAQRSNMDELAQVMAKLRGQLGANVAGHTGAGVRPCPVGGTASGTDPIVSSGASASQGNGRQRSRSPKNQKQLGGLVIGGKSFPTSMDHRSPGTQGSLLTRQPLPLSANPWGAAVGGAILPTMPIFVAPNLGANLIGDLASAFTPELMAQAQLLAPQKVQLSNAPGLTTESVADLCRGTLVAQWRELSKPRGRPSISAQEVCVSTFGSHLTNWFGSRGLANMLEYDCEGGGNGWLRFKYTPTSEHAIQPGTNWVHAWHGTWWYALWQILTVGILLESTDEKLGHEYQIPGVYVTIDRKLAESYARPQVLFSDGIYHKVMLEVRVDKSRQKPRKKTNLEQWIFPSEAIAIVAIWVRPGTKVNKGEERLETWEDNLEVLPAQ